MDEQHIRAAELVARYLQESITTEELGELADLAGKYPTLRVWVEHRDLSLEQIKKRLADYQSIDVEKDWQAVLAKRKKASPPKIGYRKWGAVAASVLLACLIGGGLLLEYRNDKTGVADQGSRAAIVPGREVATLILSDGSAVQLGENEKHTIVDGDITLDVSGSMLDYRLAQDAAVQHHKLRVPLGGIYHVQLADGTNVWLNADSELEFPSAFVGNERKVKVRGEAYFEVAKDPSKPFRVEVEDSEVEALGTAFNINTHLYKGRIKTILTEGKIKVSTNDAYQVITPGYASISGQGHIEVSKADVEEALAWKDGYFYFNSKGLKEVLGEVARWYNIEVDIRVSLSDKRYIGGIKKSESIDAICAVLSDLTAYNIVVKDQKLIVK